MDGLILARIPSSSRLKVYLLLTAGALVLFLWSMRQAYPVFVHADAPLGLASYLPPSYWVGLTLVTLASILAFLDRELKRDAAFMAVLAVLGLFLLGITVLAYESAGDPTAYYPTAEVKNLLANSHLDLRNSPDIATYYGWPAIHFISASLIEVTGADLSLLMKGTPLVWIICFVFVTYGLGKRLKLEPNHCFLISFLAISSWIINYAGYYYARFPATVLFLLLLMLLVAPQRTNAEVVAIMIMFAALVVSHGLTSVAALMALALVALYRRDFGFVTLFVVLFGGWYIWQSSFYIERGLSALALPFGDVFRYAQTERYQVAASTARLVSRYSSLCYVALYGTMALASLFMLWKRRIVGKAREMAIALFCWSIGVSTVVVFGERETLYRVLVYSVVPLACIVALSPYSRKLLVPLMCLLVPLSLFQNFGGHAGFGQMQSTYLRGSEYLATEVMPQDSFFYTYADQPIRYFDPDLRIRQDGPRYSLASPYDAGAVQSHMEEFHYILTSRLGTESALFSWNTDPWGKWPETPTGAKASLLYDNGGLQVYENTAGD